MLFVVISLPSMTKDNNCIIIHVMSCEKCVGLIRVLCQTKYCISFQHFFIFSLWKNTVLIFEKAIKDTPHKTFFTLTLKFTSGSAYLVSLM